MNAPPPVWTSLEVESTDAEHYADYWNAPLFELLDRAPRRVIDLGCSAGKFGAKIKEKHPGAHVTGVEASRAAAAKAATRLDRVFTARLETFDFAREGIQPGEFDLVVAADVLEHLVNPWQLLVRLKPYLAHDALLLASIPNVRNLDLLYGALAEGEWKYVQHGLLDVTHVRFFTLDTIRAMFEETGYVLEGFGATISQALQETYRHNRDRERFNIRAGRLTLENVTAAELKELCAEQFLLRVRPR